MIDFKRTQELLERAVDERGAEYVYEIPKGGTCLYYEGDTPSCIVGLVSSYVGLPKEVLKQYEGKDPQRIPIFSQYFDANSIALLEQAQINQDEQYNWGKAVNEAIEEIAPFVKESEDASNPSN